MRFDRKWLVPRNGPLSAFHSAIRERQRRIRWEDGSGVR